MCADINCDIMHNIRAGKTAISEENISHSSNDTYIVSEETHGCTDASMEESSDNLLVTFDYGYCDSIDSYDDAKTTNFDGTFSIEMERDEIYKRKCTRIFESIDDGLDEERESEISEDLWYTIPKLRTQESFENIAEAFQVHHVKYNNLLTVGESMPSLDSELPEFDVDDDENDCYDNRKESTNRCESEITIHSYKNFEKIPENDGIEDEEEFYDSIECAHVRNC